MSSRLPVWFSVVAHPIPGGGAAKTPDPNPAILDELLAASREADLAEAELQAARAAYHRDHSPGSLSALRERSDRALELEVKFEAMWREASGVLFGKKGPR